MSDDSFAIWPPCEVFYIHSMLFSSTSAIRSVRQLEKVFDGLPNPVQVEQLEKLPYNLILNELQNMILQAGALSRYFWPVGKTHARRGAMLREAFDLNDTSPLFNRDLRNSIEHFDERLDLFFAKSKVGVFIPEYVGPKPTDDGVPRHFFRAFFLGSGTFRLLEEEYQMEPLAKELFYVHGVLRDMRDNGGRIRKLSRSEWNDRIEELEAKATSSLNSQ